MQFSSTCTHRCSSWAIESMVVTGNFRRAPDPSCSYVTFTNMHINSECARRRSVCIASLLFVRDLCLKFGAAVLTGDFNKGAEREALSLSCGSEDQRRISPLEAAFSFASVPWPTSCVTPLWGPGGAPHGNKWPDCCGFVLLPESQNQWLIMRHGSYYVIPEPSGLKPTYQTWHYERWLHLMFAGRKRRRDTSLSDSKSRRQG